MHFQFYMKEVNLQMYISLTVSTVEKKLDTSDFFSYRLIFHKEKLH